MTLTRHLTQEDLALFALQLLEGDELKDALDHLEHCEDCRHDVARFQGDLSGYALAMSELHSPPAQARERLMKAVGKEKKAVPVEKPQEQRPMAQIAERLAAAQEMRSSAAVPVASQNGDPRFESRSGLRPVDGELFLASRGRHPMEPPVEAEEDDEEEEDRYERRSSGSALAMFLGWAGWAIAAGLAVVAGLQYRERQNLTGDLSAVTVRLQRTDELLSDAQLKLDTLTGEGAMQVSLHVPVNGQPGPTAPEGHASYLADKGALVFLADHLTPLDVSKTYELWLLPATDGQDPIPAGVFRPDERGSASVVLPELPKGVAAKGFGVTIEDAGGSKKAKGSIIMAGM